MDDYQQQKTELIDTAGALASALAATRSMDMPEDPRFEEWHEWCRGLPLQLEDDIVRVAVVGSIKSGKSTFSNSLFNADHLKRGAGVVTSIVTRVRGDDAIGAVLFFKSWEEINEEISQAMTLLPSLERPDESQSFDIRREEDRHALSRALAELDERLLLADGERNIHTVLMSLYLEGYDEILDIMPENSREMVFDRHRFAEHRRFVSNDALAVYLKDLEIHLTDTDIDDSIEIADCQGSDSPNPLHLAMIQDYLGVSHLLVYVISSRTGLRRADLRFLSMIQKMGILDNVLFVVNCDFSEHDSLEGLRALLDKIRGDLAIMVPDPEFYAFSSLYNLFCSIRSSLPEKDQRRLEHWDADAALVEFSNRETERFMRRFTEILNQQRFSLLLRNHLERLAVMSTSALNWADMRREVLVQDHLGAADLVKRLDKQQQRVNQIQSMVFSTFNGAKGKLKNDLKVELDRFFSASENALVDQVVAFIDGYTVDYQKYSDKLAASGFGGGLYLMFQEFKQALDGFLTETIQPQIVRFMRTLERRLLDYLMDIAEPFQGMTADIIAAYDDIIPDGDDSRSIGAYPLETPDVEAAKRIAGLALPSASTPLRYSARIKTEAVARLGFYRVVKLFKRALRKPLAGAREDELAALKDGMRRIKRETEKSIRFSFKNYRENIKYQYVVKLIDAVAEHLHQTLRERFDAFSTDLATLTELVKQTDIDRDRAVAQLESMAADLHDILRGLTAQRRGITSGNPA